MNKRHEDVLETCEKEQLHLSNAVQSFGSLIVVNGSGVITHCSENLEEVLGTIAKEALGQPITSILGSQFDLNLGIPTRTKSRRVQHHVHEVSGDCIDILLTDVEGGCLIELMPSLSVEAEQKTKAQTESWVSKIFGSQHSVSQKMDEAAELIANLAGFEKVMIYKFHEDWSGEVISEFGGEDVFDRYLGLRFPASDIPKIARDIYVKTPYRIIPDVDSPVVPILAARDGMEIPDLTLSDLRSVSPVHLAYLKNMDVAASLSIPIVVKDRLWGLVALHHHTKRHITFETLDQCCEVVSSLVLSLQSELVASRIAALDSMDREINGILGQLDLSQFQPEDLVQVQDDILDLFGAKTGALITGQDTIALKHEKNDTDTDVDLDAVSKIDEWFVAQENMETFSTHNFSEHLPESQSWTTWSSGLLALSTPFPSQETEVRLYLFRPDMPHEIHWAGNPEKAMTQQPEGLPVSPRDSFEKWTQVTSGQSAPWTNENLVAAKKLRLAVLRLLLH